MRNSILLIVLIFIINGCATKEPQKQVVEKKTYSKSHFYIEEFIYKKDQIEFFEQEFESILKLNDEKILQKFADFYKKNSSYFINAELKSKLLEQRIMNLKYIDTSNSHKTLLTKALSLNKKDAIDIYERLAHEENIFAQRELAEIYKYDNKLKSIFWYKKLIQNNDIKSIKDFAFANLHMVSPVVVQEPKRAVELYKKLDSLGEVSGLVHLGNIYEYGYFKDDFPVDKQQAFKYFQKAALKDYTPAQKKLARIYLCEKCPGNRYNKEEGMRLLNILVAKGDKESQEILNNINLSQQNKAVVEVPQVIQEINETTQTEIPAETIEPQIIEEAEVFTEEVIPEELIHLEEKEVSVE